MAGYRVIFAICFLNEELRNSLELDITKYYNEVNTKEDLDKRQQGYRKFVGYRCYHKNPNCSVIKSDFENVSISGDEIFKPNSGVEDFNPLKNIIDLDDLQILINNLIKEILGCIEKQEKEKLQNKLKNTISQFIKIKFNKELSFNEHVLLKIGFKTCPECKNYEPREYYEEYGEAYEEYSNWAEQNTYVEKPIEEKYLETQIEGI